MKLNKFLLLTVFCTLTGWASFAQQVIEKGYYLFPIRPGEVNFLAGTMGELRPNHFHGGLDIKTGGVTGVPVHAAAQGYISRIKISATGYGNALYMAHPNGSTTVYAHLESLEDSLAAYVRDMQYQQKTFEIELFPEKDQFSYQQGDVIALSGNSGSSGGPHLHFEVRDARQDVLNPLVYGFEEIKDDIAPFLYGIAVKSLNTSSRVNQQFGRFEFKPVMQGGEYTLSEPVEVWGKVGLEILAYDKLNGANNSNGFPCVELKINGQDVFVHKLDKFSFDQTRHIEVHMDYATRKRSGNKYVRLYLADGNELSFYEMNPHKGAVIANKADSVFDVQITLSDTYGNQRKANFTLKASQPKAILDTPYKALSGLKEAEVQENTLKFYAPVKDNTSKVAAVYANRMKYELAPAYLENNQAVYLWDLRAGLPDSVNACTETKYFNFRAMIPSARDYNLYLPEMDLHFPGKTLFDTVYLQTSYRQHNLLELFSIDEDIHPMQSSMKVKLKPQREYADKERTHVYKVSGNGRYSWEGGSWEDSKLSFRTRSLGDYTILTDSLAPEVRPVRVNSSSLSFRIWDDLSGIKSFNVYVNGEWVLMHYDYKRQILWSEKLDPKKAFKGAVELKVTDQAGNEKIYSTKI